MSSPRGRARRRPGFAARRWAFALVGVLVGCTPSGSSPDCRTTADGWSELILRHQVRYPDWELDDAFKLLHQATMGSEHAVADSTAPLRWMAREWTSMGEGPTEALVDTLGVDGRFARIHLRAWRAYGGSPDSLVAAFVQTARAVPPDTAQLGCAIAALTQLARDGRVPWRATQVASEAQAWAARHYPAMEHSPRFEIEYRPAYRVVALPLVDSLLVRGRLAEPPRVPSTRRTRPQPARRLGAQIASR
ncbi:MAG: hypothetical protein ABJC19_08475 [Gemmatimonadota bacterium]